MMTIVFWECTGNFTDLILIEISDTINADRHIEILDKSKENIWFEKKRWLYTGYVKLLFDNANPRPAEKTKAWFKKKHVHSIVTFITYSWSDTNRFFVWSINKKKTRKELIFETRRRSWT